ncbi:MAG: tetratricopeptide repeat protein [Gemmataceae bacterium]|nr:tetratricopeptide repeat protein [Gemmataceae bacterium]
MHGRVRFAGLFLAALAGCQSSNPSTNLTSLPSPKMMKPAAGEATVARAIATTDPKKRNEPIKPSTYVALGNYRDQLAANPELSFGDAEQIRSSARAAYHEALKVDPKCAAAYIGLAKSYVAIEDAQQAFAMYEKALQNVPNDAALWYEKGLTHARFKDFDGAIASFQHATKLDPDNRQYKRTLGITYSRTGKFEEAFATLRGCMKEEEAHYTLARMACHLDRPDVGREYLALSLKAHPTFMPAHQMLMELNNGHAPTTAPDSGIAQVGYSQPQWTPAPRVQVGGVE